MALSLALAKRALMPKDIVPSDDDNDDDGGVRGLNNLFMFNHGMIAYGRLLYYTIHRYA